MKCRQRKPLEMYIDDPTQAGQSILETMKATELFTPSSKQFINRQKKRHRNLHGEITARKRDKVRDFIVQLFYLWKAT
jgi:hypothetical protein